LIDSHKNEFRMHGGLAAFTTQHVGKTVLATPDRRQKRSGRKKMRQHHQAGPKTSDRGQHHQPMTIEPMHALKLTFRFDARPMRKLAREKQLSFAWLRLTFALELSACPASRGIKSASEVGKIDNRITAR